MFSRTLTFKNATHTHTTLFTYFYFILVNFLVLTKLTYLRSQKESFAKFVLFIEVFLVKNLFPPLYLLLLHLPPFISKCNSPHRDASHLGHHRKLFQILVLAEAAAPFYEDTRRIFFSGSRYILHTVFEI